MPRPNLLDDVVAWTRENVPPGDAVLAVALAAFSLLSTGLTGQDAPAVVVSAGLCLPLAVRRSRPGAGAALVALAGFLQLATVDTPLFADTAVLVAVYSLAAHARRETSLAGLLLGLFGAVVAPLRYFRPDGPAVLLVLAAFIAVMVLASWALGTLRHTRRQRQTALEDRARSLENEREAGSRLAATAERQRIAREMHDVVAHSLSVIIAQADGGRYAAAKDPQAAAEVLATISGTGRQALADMRNLLGVLRQGPGDERAPQPDARRIPDLVEQVRSSGLDVSTTVVGQAREHSPAIGLAAYRIVQESLTNVLKHAGPGTRAHVEVRWDADALRLGVDDDGRGAGAVLPAGPGGQGLLGMSERARLHGGAVQAGPRPGGGFSVRATLPYNSPAPTSR